MPFAHRVDHDRPETYSAYHTAARVLAGGEDLAVLGLKATGLDVHFPDGEVLHCDLQGRLVRIARPHQQWRRALSGRMLQVRRPPCGQGEALERCQVPQEQAEELLAASHGRLREVQAAWDAGGHVTGRAVLGTAPDPAQLDRVLALAAAFDVRAARLDVLKYHDLYHAIPILPPDQYTSLVLLASDGCRYNKCTFCNFYRDVRYRARPLEPFRQHVEQAVAYHGAALAARRQVFLGQANALLGPADWRREILQLVNRRFEFPDPGAPRPQPSWWKAGPLRFTGITSFLDAFTGTRIKASEFAAMRQCNLRQVFIGMESGSDALLRWLNKPATPEDMLKTVQAAHGGGVSVAVIVLIGAGGELFFDRHVRDTIALLQAMQLERGDCIYLSPLVPAPGAEYEALADTAGVVPLTAARLRAQEQQIRAGLSVSRPSNGGPYVAHYEVEHFMY